jgi:hypothetical protein
MEAGVGARGPPPEGSGYSDAVMEAGIRIGNHAGRVRTKGPYARSSGIRSGDRDFLGRKQGSFPGRLCGLETAGAARGARGDLEAGFRQGHGEQARRRGRPLFAAIYPGGFPQGPGFIGAGGRGLVDGNAGLGAEAVLGTALGVVMTGFQDFIGDDRRLGHRGFSQGKKGLGGRRRQVQQARAANRPGDAPLPRRPGHLYSPCSLRRNSAFFWMRTLVSCARLASASQRSYWAYSGCRGSGPPKSFSMLRSAR